MCIQGFRRGEEGMTVENTLSSPFEFKNRKDIYESKQITDESKNKNEEDRNSFIAYKIV